MTRRISRGTPYVLTSSEIETMLAGLPEGVEESVATLLKMSVTEFRALDKRVRAKKLVDFQNAGIFASTYAAAARSVTDLAIAAEPDIVHQSRIEDLEASVILLTEMVQKMTGRGLGGAA